MTIARSKIVDLDTTRWYHVISKTVRGLHLLEQREGELDLKAWIEARLEKLAHVFAVEVAGFAILDNHLHVLVRLEPEQLEHVTNTEVVLRWAALFPPAQTNQESAEALNAWAAERSKDLAYVDTCRRRLADLGWFMKCLKEPLARLANKQEDRTGTFWQPRYKSIAILDEEALLATCIYIDLNPVAAGIAELPEDSSYTSAKARVDDCRRSGRLPDLQAARQGSVQGHSAAADIGADFWLCPVDDARERTAARSGLLPGFSLGSYLMLVDYTSRLLRQGKARVSQAAASILDRLGATEATWADNFEKMFANGKFIGNVFSFRRERLAEAAQRRGQQRMVNLNGCSVR